MTDESLREAERERDRGGLVAEARLLVERVRAGTFPAARLDLLARMGDPRGRLAVGLDPVRGHDPLEANSFEERLAETIVWCTERLALGLPPRQLLRSRELRPAQFDHGENESRSQLHGRSEWCEAVQQVGRARRTRLERGELWPPGSRAIHLPEGSKLLRHDPRLQLFDGAAITVSQELFDVDYMPPWDSWVAWLGSTRNDGEWQVFDGYLVSWVPAPLVPLVQAAIDVSPSPTLAWQ